MNSKFKEFPSRERVSIKYDEIFKNLCNDEIREVEIAESFPSIDSLESMLRDVLYRIDEFSNNWLNISIEILKYTGNEKVNNLGKFPNRVAKFLKDNYNFKMSDELKSQIGNEYNNRIVRPHSIRYDITNNFGLWRDGEFGHSDSCWFSGTNYGYYQSRSILYNSGGYGLRIYDEYNNGIGRVWIFPNENDILIFNAYGIEYFQACTIIGKIFGLNAIAKIDTSSPHYTHINEEMAYRISENFNNDDFDFCDVLKYAEYLFDESDYESEGQSFENCYECGHSLYEDDYYYVDDNYYCPHCYSNYCFYCPECNEDFINDDGIELNNHTYCKSCAMNISFSCDECGEIFHNDDINFLNDENYCNNCMDEISFSCDECGEIFYNDNEFIHDGDSYCESCHIEVTSINCDECGEITPIKDIYPLFTIHSNINYCYNDNQIEI